MNSTAIPDADVADCWFPVADLPDTHLVVSPLPDPRDTRCISVSHVRHRGNYWPAGR